jgi:hypothetical protein
LRLPCSRLGYIALEMTMNDRGADRQPAQPDRTALMEQHVQARARRDQAELGSDAYRTAADEIARIEIAIAELEEPPPTAPTAS